MRVMTDEWRREELCRRLGYTFASSALLDEALTHSSWCNEQPEPRPADSERLEFLGDAVVQLAVTQHIYRILPQAAEGEMTRIRAEVVNERALAEIARGLDLGGLLRLGRGEDRTGGRDKDSLLADAQEAVFGAVFADSGFERGCELVVRLLGERLQRAVRGRHDSDTKTRLQELLQSRYGRPPLYLQAGVSGPDHCRRYTAEVRFDGETLGRGEGSSKKAAEQAAAARALERLEQNGEA